MRNEKYAIWPFSYGRIAKIAAQLSNGLLNSAMGQIPCSTVIFLVIIILLVVCVSRLETCEE